MKKVFCFLAGIVLAALIAAPQIASAQAYSLTLHQPPPNKLRVADLWAVTLINPTTKPENIYLHGVATETRTGKGIVDAQTRVYPLPPGVSVPTGSLLEPIHVNSSDNRYRDLLLQTGTVPSGDYTVCVYMINAADNQELARDCIDIHVENFSPPVLITPNDGADADDASVIFTWVPPTPMVPGSPFSYNIRITEILSRQTPYEAFTRNNVYFEQSGISATALQYPASARAFTADNWYAWKIVATLNGLPVGESEVWSFRRTPMHVMLNNLTFKPTFPVHMVAGGLGHTASVGADSSIYTWGDNSLNQLGIAAPAGATEPMPVPNIRGIKAVAAGGGHTLAVNYGGTIYAWGNNDYGQLGDGTTTSRTSPVSVHVVPPAETVAAGGLFSLALTKTGSVYFWGYTRSDESGYGITENTSDALNPGFVPTMTGIVQISAGYAHAMALSAKGEVYCWGNNDYGQTSHAGTLIPPLKPFKVEGLPKMTVQWNEVVSPIKQIAAGGFHSLILTWDGNVWAWGDNSSGQLGDGTRLSRATPMQVPGLSDIIAIAAGGTHSMALKKDSTVWVWGGNQWSMLGLGANDSMRTIPVQVPGLTKATRIACGEGHSFAVLSSGALFGWGENTYGQVGDGNRSDPLSPSATDPVKPVLVKKATP